MVSSPIASSVTRTDNDDESRSGTASTTRRESISTAAGELTTGAATPEEEPDGRSSPAPKNHTNGDAAKLTHSSTQKNVSNAEKKLAEKPKKLEGIPKFRAKLAKHIALLPISITVKADKPTETSEEINLQSYFTELKQFSLNTVTNEAEQADLSNVFDVDAMSKLVRQIARIKVLQKAKKIKLTDKQLFSLDQCELQLMQIALFQLNGSTYKSGKDKKSRPSTWLAYAGVYICIFLGVLYSGAESFTGTSDLIGGLLSIAEPITFGISVCFSILSVLLFFALEAQGFMDEAGLSSALSIPRTVRLSLKKLEVAQAFSHTLSNPKNNYEIVNNLDLYRSNHKLLKIFQKNVAAKLDSLKNPTGFLRTKVYPVIKNLFSVAGSILFACGGVIIGKDFVANIAALSFGVAFSTPVALIIIATLAVAGFCIFYALQHRGSVTTFETLTGRHKELIDGQEEFIKESGNANQRVLTNIANIEARQSAFTRIERYQSEAAENNWMNAVMPAQRLTQPLRRPKPLTAATNKAIETIESIDQIKTDPAMTQTATANSIPTTTPTPDTEKSVASYIRNLLWTKTPTKPESEIVPAATKTDATPSTPTPDTQTSAPNLSRRQSIHNCIWKPAPTEIVKKLEPTICLPVEPINSHRRRASI